MRRVLGRDAIELLRDAFTSASAGSETQRSARLLLEWEVESQAGRAVAPLEEREIAWEASAIVDVPDRGPIPYQRVPIELANLTNRKERLALDDARAALVERELVPIRRDRLQRERDFVEGLRLADGLQRDVHDAERRRSRRAARPVSRLSLGHESDVGRTPAGRCTPRPRRVGQRAHTSRCARPAAGAGVRSVLPGPEMEAVVRRQVTEMGIDPTANGRMRYDAGEREGKRSRAFCAPVRVPEEVYLVMRPHGGQTDYQTLLHELGHALHFAYTRAGPSVRVPVGRRQLGHGELRDALRPSHADAGLAAPLLGARQEASCRASSVRPRSRSCSSCGAIARN